MGVSSPPGEEGQQESLSAYGDAEKVHKDDSEAGGVRKEDHCPVLVPGGRASEGVWIGGLSEVIFKQYLLACLVRLAPPCKLGWQACRSG